MFDDNLYQYIYSFICINDLDKVQKIFKNIDFKLYYKHCKNILNERHLLINEKGILLKYLLEKDIILCNKINFLYFIRTISKYDIEIYNIFIIKNKKIETNNKINISFLKYIIKNKNTYLFKHLLDNNKIIFKEYIIKLIYIYDIFNIFVIALNKILHKNNIKNIFYDLIKYNSTKCFIYIFNKYNKNINLKSLLDYSIKCNSEEIKIFLTHNYIDNLNKNIF